MQSDAASGLEGTPRTDGAAASLDHARKLVQSAKLGEAVFLARELLASGLEDEERAEALYLVAVAQRLGNQSREALGDIADPAR